MPLVILRWTARISALLVAGGYVVLFVGEFNPPHSGPPTSMVEWTGQVLLTATCLGMLIAWRWELPGAILSLASLVAFTLMMRMGHHGVLFVFAAPGVLYLIDWLVRRAATSPRSHPL